MHFNFSNTNKSLSSIIKVPCIDLNMYEYAIRAEMLHIEFYISMALLELRFIGLPYDDMTICRLYLTLAYTTYAKHLLYRSL